MSVKKWSVTPTVSLLCEVPDSIGGSFYRGTPIATLKGSVFQASNSFRSILELNQAIINPLWTEGGGYFFSSMFKKLRPPCKFFFFD